MANMPKKEAKLIQRKLDEVTEFIPRPELLGFLEKLVGTYGEIQATQRDLAKIQAQKEVMVLEIEKKYELYHKVFDHIFAERNLAITKSFDIIDKGLQSGDKDLISMGLHTLSQVVTSSPFANVQQLSNMLEGNRIIEI